VVRVDDVVAELELDVLDLAGYLEIVSNCLLFFDCLLRNDVLLR
jgi:hypothetical protein